MLEKKDLEKLKSLIKNKTLKKNIVDVVLFTLALASLPGVVLIGSAMGNGVKFFKILDKNKKYNDKQIENAMNYIHSQKMIEYISDRNGLINVRVTRKGEIRLKTVSMDYLKINKQKKWDNKWRVIMFDLPVKYKNIRNSLRYKLKQIGFMQLQKSVWVYPYPCIDELLFIANYYRVSKYVEILTVEEIVNEKKLKSMFNLR